MKQIKKEDHFLEENNEDEELEGGKVKKEEISQLVLNATDWTTETILSQLDRKNIDLSPRFQRRDAWSRIKKSRFIESLLLGLPIPQIVLAEKQESRGKYIVLDGKQRLLTLLQFTNRAEGKNNNFKLTGLEVREDLNNIGFFDFEEKIQYKNDLNILYNQTIRTVVIRNWTNSSLLHMIFLRLNTTNAPLSPQELRLALLPGKFVHYLDDRACKSIVIQSLLGINEPDFRMRDVEILLRFLSFSLFLENYSGNLKDFLDETCQKLNEEWPTVEMNVEEKIEQFEQAIIAAEKIFGKNNVGHKWTTHGFEPRFNRAILDVIVFYFSSPTVRTCSLRDDQTMQKILEAFKTICLSNEQFKASIERATGSLISTFTRLQLWGESLQQILSMDLQIPTWDNKKNRIID